MAFTNFLGRSAKLCFLIIMCGIILIACDSDTSDQGGNGSDPTLESESPAKQVARIYSGSTGIGIDLSYLGEFLQGARWKVGGRTHYGVWSLTEEGEIGQPGWQSVLNVYLYQEAGATYSLLDQYGDRVPDSNSRIIFAQGQTRLLEMESGDYAVVFAYAICPEDGSSCTHKASLLHANRKFDVQAPAGASARQIRNQQKAVLNSMPEAAAEVLVAALTALDE